MSEGYETVTFTVRDAVATITLNRPEGLNAWNAHLGADLRAALESVRDDDTVRAAVITGAGRGFCSGADLRGGLSVDADGRPDLYTSLVNNYNPVILGARRIPKPIIAAVNGGAAGVGASLAMACDVVIAAESAYFLLAFANIGLSIDGGASALLSGRVGFTHAAEMALMAQRIPAEQALGWGLVNRVVPDDELPAAASEVAARFAAGPPGAYAAIKDLLNENCFAGLEAALEHEAVLQGERGRSRDFAEGVTAFLEKRPAVFSGA